MIKHRQCLSVDRGAASDESRILMTTTTTTIVLRADNRPHHHYRSRSIRFDSIRLESIHVQHSHAVATSKFARNGPPSPNTRTERDTMDDVEEKSKGPARWGQGFCFRACRPEGWPALGSLIDELFCYSGQALQALRCFIATPRARDDRSRHSCL